MIDYIAQHKRRLAWMPGLYYKLKPKALSWAKRWQADLQAYVMSVETVEFGDNCFIAPDCHMFAEPGRKITMGDNCFIASASFMHGPMTLGHNVAINHSCSFDGGKNGISIGDDTRIANNCVIHASNHGMHPDQVIWQQASTSKGVSIGKDVWVGANVGIVDGVTIADYAVIGMHSMITKDVPRWAIMAGNPAHQIGDRRDKKDSLIKHIQVD
ncbi:MAG: acyltransferase [Moritella sp.]|uniref:acyltransferase n=1 Tax=Moritella sp. TaxID=78556 RepID=UPI000C0D6919|nr:acyltransferase [Moritella sp.]MBL1418477.1 acyltransferase [Moritella sp.]PHR88770.1 MAG: acyltransferase [Moritella sp.]